METLTLNTSSELLPDIKLVLKKLKTETSDEMSGYDVKNEWITEIVENAASKMNKFVDENFSLEPHNATTLQKMCCYKISSTEVDCDVALRSVVIYALAFGLSDAVIQRQKDFPYKFCLTMGDFDYIGDTMNSYATSIHKFLRIDEKGNRKLGIYERNNEIELSSLYTNISRKNYWDACILHHHDYFDKKISTEAHTFIGLNHTIGNLIPVPRNFNAPRAGKTNDYWDLTLRGIYNWFQSGNIDSNAGISDIIGSTRTYEDIERNWCVCRKWLSTYANWDDFVTKNFMQDFVEGGNGTYGYGTPKELWEGHFNGTLLPKRKSEFEQFFTNASMRILARGSRIVDVVKSELSNGVKVKEV